ncbi:MAG TPA: ASCH domain-containing protein [Methylophilaceae bacterium]|nr:ASCH domain-containing protein [Methylophilaceae bacterium]
MDLIIPVMGIYFDQIKAGTKNQEFRLFNDYWKKRLEGRTYRNVILTRGYPKRDDTERRLVRKWNGYTVETITHEFFGNKPEKVFAIDVSSPQPSPLAQKPNEQSIASAYESVERTEYASRDDA